ncbi:Leucine carboxyl methyltransferase 1 [Rhizophlyctis rosea]|nr:Leucine carboxyl methyltransferase 1 [Rhizophlyctis rosea]
MNMDRTPFGHSSQAPLGDDAVRSTNDDAAVSRLSAVNLGYLTDPYLKSFVRRPQRRPPIINRGTYTRSAAIDSLTLRFLGDSPSSKQIVSLGAGSDTRYFLLKARNTQPKRYFEIDFPEITSRKAQAIKRSKELTGLIGEHSIAGGGTELHGHDYFLLAGDLRQFDSTLQRLVSLGFDKSLPTLFLSECVLIYLDPSDADRVVEQAASFVTSGAFLTYEQILPDDAFGTMMLQNLKVGIYPEISLFDEIPNSIGDEKARNLELPGIHAYPTLDSQRGRYLKAGWKQAFAMDLNEFWEKRVEEDEKARVSRLEIFDEVEEWHLLSGHYCISWAVKGHALLSPT